MDTGKYPKPMKAGRLIIIPWTAVIVSLAFRLHAEEPAQEFSLPEITITGEDISTVPWMGEKSKSIFHEEVMEKPSAGEEEEKESVTVLKAGAGRYDSEYADFLHAGKAGKLRYFSRLDFYDTGGWRDHSAETSYRPEARISSPVFESSELSFNARSLGKDMELPGPVTAPTPDSDRRVDEIFLSLRDVTERGQNDTTYLEIYSDYGRIDEDPGRTDYENWVHGFLFTNEKSSNNGTENEIKLEIARHEMVDRYQFLTGSIQGLKKGIQLSDKLSAYLGGRLDSQEGSETAFGPIIGLDVYSGKKTSWRAGLSRTFDVARFSRLYLDDNFVEPNPAVLDPERTLLVELNMEHHFNEWFSGGFSLFRKDARDILTWDDPDGNGLLMPVNVREASINGLKAEMKYYWTQRLGQHLSYVYQDITSKDAEFTVVPYYPEEKIDLGFFYQMNRFLRWDISGEYYGEQHADKDDTGIFIPEYFLVSAEATYSYKKDRDIFLRIENLLNEGFELVKDYPGPGRNIILGARVKF